MTPIKKMFKLSHYHRRWKTIMRKLDKYRKFLGRNNRSRRTLPYLVPRNICLIPRKVLPVRRICLSLRLVCVAEITNITPVHVVRVVVGATRSSPGYCTMLDDKLVPSTSNAVERCNRRHRKRQKTVY